MLAPMASHKKDGTPVLARLRGDLAKVRDDLYVIAGLWVVVRHLSVGPDGVDYGWDLAGPFGYGGLPDEWFVGWQALPQDECVMKEGADDVV